MKRSATACLQTTTNSLHERDNLLILYIVVETAVAVYHIMLIRHVQTYCLVCCLYSVLSVYLGQTLTHPYAADLCLVTRNGCTSPAMSFFHHFPNRPSIYHTRYLVAHSPSTPPPTFSRSQARPLLCENCCWWKDQHQDRQKACQYWPDPGMHSPTPPAPASLPANFVFPCTLFSSALENYRSPSRCAAKHRARSVALV